MSTFLVTNAQFPEQLENLSRVTQLYLSIDASTKEDLKKVDRPVFENFWERFKDSINILSKKKDRTVFRLTLVKDWNMNGIEEYAKLVEKGNPSFIEIKSFTYSGYSPGSELKMDNVPYFEDVMKFAKAFESKISENYEISVVHEHSMFILISHKKYKINGGNNPI
jgi:tRNA wybutosine-synthesizing protein 1